LRAPGTKRGQRAAPATLSARLVGHVSLEAQASGEIVACFDGFSVGLGTFGAAAAERALGLRTGLPLSSFGPDGRDGDKEIDQIVRRLAARGLLEYRLGGARKGEDEVVIEPQVPGYWPRMSPLGDADVLVLSRFAYLRRRANEMVLESPRAGALFKIEAGGDDGLRPAEGDDNLVLWDFHDLVFHARSTEGRHANPLGGLYPYVDVMNPLPAVRPP